tara:strand:- start:238 stop:3261 length:3024 start_codon:yes stop_codon:yes gene_type:complete
MMRIFTLAISIFFFSISFELNSEVKTNVLPTSEGDAPVISNLSASPNTVDVTTSEATITLTVEITDASGVDPDQFWSKPSIGKPWSSSIYAEDYWSLVSGDYYDGVYEATIIVPVTAGAGEYYICSSFVYDIYGNYGSACSGDGAAGGGVTVNSSRESDGPLVSNLSASPNIVDVTSSDATITLSVDVTDESGVDPDQFWSKPFLTNDSSSTTIRAEDYWTLVSGDYSDGTYEATIIVPTTAGAGDYAIGSSFFYDIYENVGTSVTGDGADNGGVTINSSRESDAPVLSNLSFTPSTVDVTSSDATINLTIDVTDASGIDISQFLTKPSLTKTGSPSVSADSNWSLVSGDYYDGTYEATISVPQQTNPGDYSVSTGFFYDIYENLEGQVTDPGASAGGVTIVVTNSPPKIRSSSFDVNENQTNIGKLKVKDADGDTLTYAITGTSAISINSSTGQLTFRKPPNYEHKSKYTFKAFVNDGTETKSKRITVNIIDVNEPPSLSATRFSVNQGETRKVNLLATDPESDSISYKLSSGGDAAYFSLNSSTGVLRFREVPNFSKITIFDIPVSISDGSNTQDYDIRLTLNIDYIKQLGEPIQEDYTEQRGIQDVGVQSYMNKTGTSIFLSALSTNKNGNKSRSGRIASYKFQSGEWILTDEIIGTKELEYLGYWSPFYMNNNLNKVYATSCHKENDNGSCDTFTGYSTSDDKQYKAVIRSYEFNSTFGTWDTLAEPKIVEGPEGIAIEESLMGVDSRGKILGTVDFKHINDTDPTLCTKPILTRNKIKQGSWKKFKKPLRVRASRPYQADYRIDHTGTKFITYNRGTCDDNYDPVMSIYEYVNNNWQRIGNAMRFNGLGTVGVVDDIKINKDFNKIAFRKAAADGTDNNINYIYFYFFNEIKNRWILQDFSLPVIENNESFDISDDFLTIAVVNPGDLNDSEYNQSIQIYKFKNGSWKKFANSFSHPEESSKYFGRKINLSDDGNRLLVYCPSCPKTSEAYDYTYVYEIVDQ